MAPLSDEHIPAVAAALHRLEVDHSRYPFPIKFNLTKAIQHVIEKGLAGEAYVGHGCLLLVSVQEPWYSDTVVLCEEFILAIEPNANLRAVIKFLDQLARGRNADMILSGNTLQDPRLSRLYQRAGYRHVTDQFYKEPTWEE